MYRLMLSFLASMFLTAAAWAQPVTFGASVQLTGPVANTGRYYRDAYEFAVDRINAAGGIKIGSAHRKIALKILDNQSDVNLSVRQYVQLLSQDKVNFLLGPFASNFVLADSSIAEKARVPMVQGGGASDQIYSRGYQYVFGTLPAASNYFGSTIEAMTKLNPRPQTVALLYADDSFDVSVAKGTRELLNKAGLKTVIDERYSTNASDFSVLLSRIKSENADAVLVAGHETEVLNFVRQANPRGLFRQSTVVLALGETILQSTKLPEGTIVGVLGDGWWRSPDAQEIGKAEAFAEAYKAKYGAYPVFPTMKMARATTCRARPTMTACRSSGGCMTVARSKRLARTWPPGSPNGAAAIPSWSTGSRRRSRKPSPSIVCRASTTSI